LKPFVAMIEDAQCNDNGVVGFFDLRILVYFNSSFNNFVYYWSYTGVIRCETEDCILSGAYA